MDKDIYMPKTKLIIPGNNLFLETALSFIVNCADVFEFKEDEIFQIRLASEEAISNIIKHAFSNNIKEYFEITCFLERTQFKIVLHEKGKPFDIKKVTHYDPNKMDVDGDAKGLGSFLMQKYMDVVEYKNKGRDGKETILIKYSKSQRFDNILKNQTSVKTNIEDFSFIVREFVDDDAIGVSECAYSAYGYTYEPYIYYPSKIVEMNKADKMHSFVVQNNNKEIIGHIALKYDNNPSVAEKDVAFVKQEYRGKNVFNDKLDYSLNISKSIKSLKCVFGRAVTSHTISQDVLLERGAIPTAMALALFPSDVEFKDLSGKVKQKDAALFLCINTKQDNTSRDLYLPRKHKKIIKDIFTSLDYNFSVKSTQGYNDSKYSGTRIDYKIIDIFNCAEIYCTNYQKDSIHKIGAVLKTLCLNRVDAIYLYLDLEDSSLEAILLECERIGFFFAGVVPFGINTHHAIVLQYLNNLEFDFNAIKISDSNAKNLKDYILICYNKAIGIF